ncbi:hypothetical protein [Sphingomonas aerolata]|uniref:hypothetical protein n=1 Tax=Sphingomonas aerolata TaxID=185951 RepID=UPI001D4608B5|nr:hypothetical protein [Sphingomonas aerolata]NII58324.1 hypothetical protein [Sphingomonas aerolata]
MNELGFSQGGFHPAEITGSTRRDDVVEITRTASAIRQDVIELKPHALKARMLTAVRRSPRHRDGIGRMSQFPNHAGDYRHAAEPAMIPVALHDRTHSRKRRHSGLWPQLATEVGWRIRNGDESMPLLRASSPGGVGESPDYRIVRQGKQAFCFLIAGFKMGFGGLVH